MWLFTKYGFFSVVQTYDDPEKMMIRGRCREDLERLAAFALDQAAIGLPDNVIETPKADYHYRLICDRADWLVIAYELAQDVDYGNFKNQIKDDYRHSLYERVWGVMRDLQNKCEWEEAQLRFDPDDLPAEGRTYFDDLADDNLPSLPDELDDPDSPFYDPGRWLPELIEIEEDDLD